MEKKRCRFCGASLSQNHSGDICSPCEESGRGCVTAGTPEDMELYDVQDIQRIWRLESEEHVRRLGREEKIPGRIRGIKRHLYLKEVVDEWLKSAVGAGAIISHSVVVPETHETILPSHALTCYHRLGKVPDNVLVTVTDKGVLGPPPVVGQFTASSYILTSLVSSGQIVRHTPIPPAPGPSTTPARN